MRINRAACALCLLLTGALFLHAPDLSFWKMSLPNERYVVVLLLANLIFAFSFFAPVTRQRVGLLLGVVALLSFEGPGLAAGLLLLPSVALVFFRSVSNGWARFAFAAGILAGLYGLRFHSSFDLITIFMVSFWIKIVSLALTERSGLPAGLDGHIRTAFYFFAPPFLLGPLPLEWIRFSYFDAKVVNRISNEKRALRMLALGLLFLVVATFGSSALSARIANYFLVFNETTPWWHQALWGYSLFISRYFTLGGLTAISVGLFQLAQIELKYDFHRPFLARDFLEFWSRYHSYGKDFLYAHVYLPVYFRLPKFMPHYGRGGLGLIAVFTVVAIVQHVNYVPAQFAAATDYYSFRGCIQHSAVSVSLLLWTMIVRSALLWAVKREAGLRLAAAANWISWAHTQVAIGYFFFGAYWNLWKGLPLDQFFLRILWE